MEVRDFSEIEAEFIKRVHTMVWCSAATVDVQGRPRSRILHPIWEGATGWVGTHRNKARHLARNPYMSLAYITEIMKPVYVDCTAEWVDGLKTGGASGICSRPAAAFGLRPRERFHPPRSREFRPVEADALAD